jgi:hypothetical protein
MDKPETKPAETKPADDDTAEFPAVTDPDADADGYGIWTGEWWERPYKQ